MLENADFGRSVEPRTVIVGVGALSGGSKLPMLDDSPPSDDTIVTALLAAVPYPFAVVDVTANVLFFPVLVADGTTI